MWDLGTKVWLDPFWYYIIPILFGVMYSAGNSAPDLCGSQASCNRSRASKGKLPRTHGKRTFRCGAPPGRGGKSAAVEAATEKAAEAASKVTTEAATEAAKEAATEPATEAATEAAT